MNVFLKFNFDKRYSCIQILEEILTFISKNNNN